MIFDPQIQFPRHSEPSTPGWPHLNFVVKLHRAKTLHVDFRLEVHGLLASWLLPTYPNIDPLKSVAARVMPDHDRIGLLSERCIPPGNYGAGPVAVIDFGTYIPLGAEGRSHDETVRENLLKGWLEFELHGEVLKGGFRLHRQANEWNLRKLPDEFSSTVQPEWTGRSILTSRSLDEIAANAPLDIHQHMCEF